MRSRSLFLAVAILASACVTTGANAGAARDQLMLSGTDKEKASTQLADYLKQRGFDASLNSPNAVLVKGDVNILLSPELMESGIDRIMVAAIYSFTDKAKAQHLDVPEVMRLNHDFDFAQFSIDDDGDLFILSSITFVDAIDFAEVMHYLTYFRQACLTAVGSVSDPELLE